MILSQSLHKRFKLYTVLIQQGNRSRSSVPERKQSRNCIKEKTQELPISRGSRLCVCSMIRTVLRVFRPFPTHSCISGNLSLVSSILRKSFATRFSMESTQNIVDIDGLRASVVKQGGLVRQLKKDGASQEEVTAGRE